MSSAPITSPSPGQSARSARSVVLAVMMLPHSRVAAEADAGAASTAPATSRDNEARMATPFWSAT
jgi:hypothetical protein